MKKLFLIVFSCLTFFLFSTSFSFAQEDISITPSPSPTPVVKKQVEYDLPYAGILPDNPLYILKTLRDKIVGLLIADSLKKAEFNLLNADKRISSGVALLHKKKEKLGLETISKSNNYFHAAISSASEAQQQGKDVNSFLDKLLNSCLKHQELLQGEIATIHKSYKNSLINEQNRLKQFQKSISAIPKNKK